MSEKIRKVFKVDLQGEAVRTGGTPNPVLLHEAYHSGPLKTFCTVYVLNTREIVTYNHMYERLRDPGARQRLHCTALQRHRGVTAEAFLPCAVKSMSEDVFHHSFRHFRRALAI